MAADEVLLEAAEAGRASLRFYGWSPATLSLGYFQSAACRAEFGLESLPFVRRPSGGEALVHHHELTYALALPAGPPWQTRREPWLRRMHEVLAVALADLGVPVSLCPEGAEQRLGPFLCFRHHTSHDVRIGQAKVCGSAQRRRQGALLQHGGVLLAACSFTRSLPGIEDLTGQRLPVAELRGAVRTAFSRNTGWDLSEQDPTDRERSRAEGLAESRYASVSWNLKR